MESSTTKCCLHPQALLQYLCSGLNSLLILKNARGRLLSSILVRYVVDKLHGLVILEPTPRCPCLV